MSGARAFLAAACLAATCGSAIRLRDTSALEWSTRPTAISFMQGGREYMRVDPDGRVFVNGKAVTEDPEMYRLMKRWLEDSCRVPTEAQR